jgi:hypothetical protein
MAMPKAEHGLTRDEATLVAQAARLYLLEVRIRSRKSGTCYVTGRMFDPRTNRPSRDMYQFDTIAVVEHFIGQPLDVAYRTGADEHHVDPGQRIGL